MLRECCVTLRVVSCGVYIRARPYSWAVSDSWTTSIFGDEECLSGVCACLSGVCAWVWMF